MAYNDDLPTWGATGSKPSDGTSRSPGDNIDASEYNYLWYILNETFGDIDTDVSNIETGGVADDPHGNEAHSPNFLAQTDYDPAGDIDFSQLLVNNPHDNSAHSETYLTDTYDPSTDLNFPTSLDAGRSPVSRPFSVTWTLGVLGKAVSNEMICRLVPPLPLTVTSVTR